MDSLTSKIIDILFNNSLSVTLIIAGIICIFIAIVGEIPIINPSNTSKISKTRAILLSLFGIFLILASIGLSWVQAVVATNQPLEVLVVTATPALIPTPQTTTSSLLVPSSTVEPTATSVNSSQEQVTATIIATPPDTANRGLTSCTAFQNGETRGVSSGSFVIGDVIIDNVPQYDSGGIGEGTVAYFEKEATVTAQWGAGCYLGDKSLIEEIVQGELQHGCGSQCTRVRVVIIQADGRQQVSYIP
jgi:hypothetical protein